MSHESCLGCGIEKDQWGDNEGNGYKEGQLLFCCRGCANDTACTCFLLRAKKNVLRHLVAAEV